MNFFQEAATRGLHMLPLRRSMQFKCVKLESHGYMLASRYNLVPASHINTQPQHIPWKSHLFFSDLGSSLVGEVQARPPQHKEKLPPGLPTLLFGVEVSVHLRTGAGVEEGLRGGRRQNTSSACVSNNLRCGKECNW